MSREDHATLLAAGASELLPAGPGSGGFVTEVGVRWAAAILLSRAFSLDLHENVRFYAELLLPSLSSGRHLAVLQWDIGHPFFGYVTSQLFLNVSVVLSCSKLHGMMGMLDHN